MTRLVIPDRNAPHPWEVFVDLTAVHQKDFADTEPIRMLGRGEKVSGLVHTNQDTDEDWLATNEGFVPLTTIVRVHPDNRRPGNLPIGEEIIDRWWGLPMEYTPDDLVTIPSEWHLQDGKEYLLRPDALKALLEMLDAARRDGIEIRVLSSWRSGNYQLGLYTRAIERNGRSQRASAPPGHSEHQLGTVVDLCDVEEREVLTQEFGETPQGEWLKGNAARFGFHLSYTRENSAVTGYIPEPWHWRYWGR